MDVSPVVLLDDGEFYIETHPDYPLLDAPGALYRRCGRNGRGLAPDAECIGSFDMHPDTTWSASINTPSEVGGTATTVVMDVMSRVHAIVVLWHARREAFFRL